MNEMCETPASDTQVQEFTVDNGDGLRIDVFLAEHTACEISRSQVQKLLADGHVLVGGVAVAKSYRVSAGDVIHCTIALPPPFAEPEPIPLDIAFEDAHLLVVNKPRGLVVHPGVGNPSGTLVNALLAHCPLSDVNSANRPGIVHRLDRDTSGLLIVAKTNRAHNHIAAQLHDRSVVRKYIGICVGVPARQEFVIDAPIGRHPRVHTKMAVLQPPRNGLHLRTKQAITSITVLETYAKHALFSARLHTGRTHQIRVHMAHMGFPLLGDTKYSAAKQATPGGQILHAKTLAFRHPISEMQMEFDSDVPEYFRAAMEVVGGSPIATTP